MDYYDKLNAKYYQEESAVYAEWALDYLLSGNLEKAAMYQALSAHNSLSARLYHIKED